MDSLKPNLQPIRMRNYGRIIQNMIGYCCTLPESDEQRALITYIAQCMRQKNLIWNKDQESNWERIKKDISTLSNGQLNCDFEGFETTVLQVAQQQLGKKKKK